MQEEGRRSGSERVGHVVAAVRLRRRVSPGAVCAVTGGVRFDGVSGDMYPLVGFFYSSLTCLFETDRGTRSTRPYLLGWRTYDTCVYL